MVQSIHHHNNELYSLKELKMPKVRVINSFEDLLKAIAEDFAEKQESEQEQQSNNNFDTCVKISKIITNLEFIIQELKSIRTELSK